MMMMMMVVVALVDGRTMLARSKKNCDKIGKSSI